MKSTILLRDPVNPHEERLWSAFLSASQKLRDAKTGQGAEKQYEIAYQNLVKEGLVMSIKRKYRG